MKWYLAVMACMIGTISTAQQPQQLPPVTPNTAAVQNELSIMETIATTPSLSKFRAALLIASLDNLLNLGKPLTIFAPSNAAFEKLSPTQLHDLYDPKNLSFLQSVLKNHVVRETISPEMLAHLNFKTMQGTTMSSEAITGGIIVGNTAKATLPPLKASNGLIYIIDTVLYPPSGK